MDGIPCNYSPQGNYRAPYTNKGQITCHGAQLVNEADAIGIGSDYTTVTAGMGADRIITNRQHKVRLFIRWF